MLVILVGDCIYKARSRWDLHIKKIQLLLSMSLQTRYRLLFILLYLAAAYILDVVFALGWLIRYPFFFGMLPVLLGMYTANYVTKRLAKKTN